MLLDARDEAGQPMTDEELWEVGQPPNNAEAGGGECEGGREEDGIAIFGNAITFPGQ